MQKRVKVGILIEDEEFCPTYGTAEAAGADLRAAITEDLLIEPGESQLIPTGVRLEIPEGYEVQLRPRSGLALKSQITLLNSPGTIDSDYRGELKLILINHGKEPFRVTRGMRIGQMILAPVFQVEFIRQESLEMTLRGEAGFGHTGAH